MQEPTASAEPSILDTLYQSYQESLEQMLATCPQRTFPLPDPEMSVKRPLDFAPFSTALLNFSPEQAATIAAAINGKTIPELQALMADGQLSSEQLVLAYLARIQRYDEGRLNTVMELNPEALAIAQTLDAERIAGNLRGPLHGIPVLLKDNIATAGPMHTTAGNYALKDWQADRDAFLVMQLREAGAIILGKNNLSEWANYTDPCMPNGFSALGGQTRNPPRPLRYARLQLGLGRCGGRRAHHGERRLGDGGLVGAAGARQWGGRHASQQRPGQRRLHYPT